MNTRKLQIDHLDRKMNAFGSARNIDPPPQGWIKALRSALGMSLKQLGKRLSVSIQAVKEFENREMAGSITINSLKSVASAMEMQLVYGFVAKDGSLEALIERKAREIATEIVLRTANTMKLEDQGISQERLVTAMEERIITIKNEIPKTLWD